MKNKEVDTQILFRKKIHFLIGGHEFQTQIRLLKSASELYEFLSPFDSRTKNILMEMEIYSKEDLRLAFKNDSIGLGSPKGIGKKSYEILYNLVKDEDTVSEKIAFRSNFPVYIQNFLKGLDINNAIELYDFLMDKDVNKRFLSRKKTIKVLKEYLVKEMTK